ncbi:tryptophan halogenase [Shewanella colwelliana]|uniref:tryptophan halogenase family protein n=1 Tax=Shewanella colwelliana TaxID=23 RepID=UPI001BBFF453|nr:tryptophan halogenase family protein [Shewanella colwelliana]MDX1280567.1 tryptophan halogenase family protein [Shewanella colwelliana]GIU26014.1 tryptophan halogenase [Shewanella colwelliana]
MSDKPISSITIVGGGSSGWMTAMYLQKLYNQSGGDVKITLIESQDIGTIGVGEATVHTIRFFFAAMGLDETELLRETNATLKSGIMFRNWMKPKVGNTHEYFHPFEQQRPLGPIDNASTWVHSPEAELSYADATSISAELIKHQRCPKAPNSPPYQGVVPYGYHLDATLMGRYLRKKACEAGVIHVESIVTDVNTDGESITSVTTPKGEFSSDIFIDCTGFKGLLIEKLRSDNWQSFEKELPCNKAVAIQRKYPQDMPPKSYTVATALSNGWVWEIDLSNRQGTGYVYDGNRLTKEQAEAELRAHLGDELEILRTVHLDMRIGCRKAFWVGNCIAIGLSGGFIEPLESTGLHIVNVGARLLATHLSSANPPQAVRDSYNRTLNGVYEDLRQFIILHYCLTDRDDTEFWREAAKTAKYAKGLQDRIDIWKHKTCEYMDLAGSFNTIFTDENYRFVLYGMDHVPAITLPTTREALTATLARLKAQQQQALDASMSHEAFLAKLAK